MGSTPGTDAGSSGSAGSVATHGRAYSGALPDADWPLTGVTRVGDLATCIADSVGRAGDGGVAVIPEGPYVIPVLRSAA